MSPSKMHTVSKNPNSDLSLEHTFHPAAGVWSTAPSGDTTP